MDNTTGSPIKVKHGLKLGDCLLYDREVVTKPSKFPTVCVALKRKSIFDTDINGQGPSINLAVKLVDYPELRHSLTDLL